MNDIEKSVLVPIIFFSWFKFPLHIRELRRYLWQKELSEEEIKKIIRLLPAIHYDNELVWHGDISLDRLVNATVAKGFWAKTKTWRWLFANTPFLRRVFVANTLAYDNVRTGSDIDLFIVGQSGRLWTARAALLVLMNLFGLRVRGVNRHGKFSPEFWIGDTELNLNPIAIENDYYLSYWLADLTSVWPGGDARDIWRANPWLKQNLPIAWRSPRTVAWPVQKPSLMTRLLEKILAGSWGDSLERKLKTKQCQIIKRNLIRLATNPSVLMEDNVIKLHFNDRRARVRDVIEESLSEVLG